MSKAAEGINEKTELGEVSKEFNENRWGSSNISRDEATLTWRGDEILREVSPESAAMVKRRLDILRSVKGWNTNMKVQAIGGVQERRSGLSSAVGKFFGRQ